MSNDLVTQNDIAQVLSRTLLDVAAGRAISKSEIEKKIEIADAINRRIQTKINLGKLALEARKHGVDFAALMAQVNNMVDDTSDALALANKVAE